MGAFASRTGSHTRPIAVLLAVLVVLSFMPITPVQAITTTYYVNVSTGNDGNAGTAGQPFKSIGKGLDVAQAGDTVRVSPGVYSATSSGEVFPLEVSAGVKLTSTGGSSVTVIDGEQVLLFPAGLPHAPLIALDGSDTARVQGFSVVNGVFEVGGGIYVDNSLNVVFEDVVVDECYATLGGGMFVSDSSVALRDCVFQGNPMGFTKNGKAEKADDYSSPNAWLGGGLFAGGSSLVLDGCEFAGNSAVSAGASAYFVESSVDVQDTVVTDGHVVAESVNGDVGPRSMTLEGLAESAPQGDSWADSGEMDAQGLNGEEAVGGGFVFLASEATVLRTAFENNGAPVGGAIFVDEYSDVTVSSSRFDENYAIWGSGIARVEVFWYGPINGIVIEQGLSALENADPPTPVLTIDKSIFNGNWMADSVVGISNDDGATVEIVNSLFYDNEAFLQVYAEDTSIMNSTFADNYSFGYGFPEAAGEFGSAEFNGFLIPATVSADASSTVVNSIFWGNEADYPVCDNAAEPLSFEPANGGPVDVIAGYVAYTNTEHGIWADTHGDGNISEDPLFLGLTSHSYRLRPGSPSIDTGTEDGAPGDDLLGNARPYDGDFDGVAVTDMGAYEYMPAGAQRLGGPDRYDTAIKISKEHFESAETVIVARGDVFADGLTCSGLAGLHGAPVLLTPSTHLPVRVAEEIERLGAEHAVIVGGTVAVSNTVKTQIEALGLTVERIGGANRYKTAELIAAEIAAWVGDPEVTFVVRGDNFPDALTVSPVGYGLQAPILLARPAELPQSGVGIMSVLSAGTSVYIAGGTDAVSSEIEGAVRATGSSVNRIGGANRHATSALFSEHAVDEGWARYDFVGMATGQTFPDALTGGAAIGRAGGVLMLTPRTSLHPEVQRVLQENRTAIFVVEVFGGPMALSDAVKASIEAALGG